VDGAIQEGREAIKAGKNIGRTNATTPEQQAEAEAQSQWAYMAGHGIFLCETRKGARFEAKMIGALTELKRYYRNPRLAIGRMLTVQFQGYTNKAGVPRFPVALRFRDDL
jgi:hypothetical protein